MALDLLGIGSIAAPIVGGLFGASSAKSQNKAAARAAQAQMDFQREMSNTAHQREVQDLKLAGLNPILSAGGGGASAPSGASYTPVSEAAGISEGISSALQQRLLQAQLDNIKQDTAVKRQTEALVNDQSQQTIMDTAVKRFAAEGLKMDNVLKSLDADLYSSSAGGALNVINKVSKSGVGGFVSSILGSAASKVGSAARGLNTTSKHVYVRPPSPPRSSR